MKHTSKQIAALILFSLYTHLAFSFDQDRHAVISALAIETYQKSCPDTFSYISERQAQLFIKGALSEDNITIGRLLNWHFYNRDFEDESGNFLHKYLDRIYEKKVEEFHKSILIEPLSFNTYYSGGKVSHYIQDMTVPSHVVPIYHFKFLNFKVIDDFDAYVPSQDIPIKFTSEDCARVQTEIKDKGIDYIYELQKKHCITDFRRYRTR